MAETPASNVKSLILLMLLSVSCAVAISIFSVQKFGPTGAYEVKNALITPYLLENMSYDDVDAKTGATMRFVFDKMLFSYRDGASQKDLTIPVTFAQYRFFYDSISGDSSIVDGGGNLAPLFDNMNPSKLIVKVKTVATDPLESEVRDFQQVEFAAEGNFYRIKLREEMSPQDEWAYYNHVGIKEKIYKLLNVQP